MNSNQGNDSLVCHENYQGLDIYVKKPSGDGLVNTNYVFYEIYKDGTEHLQGSSCSPENFLIGDVNEALEIARSVCDYYVENGSWAWQVSDEDRLQQLINTLNWIS